MYGEEFNPDRPEALQRAREAGVGKIVFPDIDASSRTQMLEVCDQYSGMVFPLIGLHPTSVNQDYKTELTVVEKELGKRKFYGIGECGLDFYWDTTFYKEQIKTLEYQLGLARETGLPVVIHSRESLDEIFAILKKHPYVTGILHCFPGNAEQARQAVDMGFLLGIGGIVTFKNSDMGQVVKTVGLEALVLETDAPYLAPVPYRGKRNESSYIPVIARKIEEITGESLKKIEETTTRNAGNLFNLQ